MFSKISVKKPYTVLVGVIVVIVLGIVSFTRMTPDLLPSMNMPYAIVMTTYVGASPEEVEQTVTRPIEQSMASINNIKNITSTSSENVSLVILEFNDDANMDSITVDMRESLDTISSNWSDSIGNPMIMKLNPDMMPTMIVALNLDGMSLQEISDYANDTLIPSLESIDGVASVSASGLLEENINVVIREDKVEEINKKLKKNVSDNLDDAKKDLDDAKKTLDEKQEELEDALQQFRDGTIQGSQAITEGRLEILKNEIKMADGEEELSAKEQELLNGLAEIEAQEQTLNETEATLLDGETQLIDGLAQIDDGLAQMDEQLPQLYSAKTQLEDFISQISMMGNSTGNLTIGTSMPSTMLSQLVVLQQALQQMGIDPNLIYDIPQLTVELNNKLDEINTGIATIEETKPQLEAQREELVSKLDEVQSAKVQLAEGKEQLLSAKSQALEGKAQLDQAKAQLEDGKQQLEDGKQQLNDSDAELQNTKEDTGKQINDGLDAIKQGQTQVDDAIDNWDDTVNDALDQASVTDTITVDMISKILQAQNFSMPAGYVTEDGVDYLIRVGDKVEDVEELKNLVLFDLHIDGIEPIKLSDVADVFMVDNSDEIFANVNGKDGLILTFQKQTTYSTAEVAESIQKKLSQISEEDSNISFVELMNQGDYIDLIVNSVLSNLVQGAVFAIIVLFLFLKDWRPTLIIALSIPISVIFAITLMYFTGISLNIISLSGLAIGVGMLVDNSVVVIENVYRLRNKGLSAIKSSVSGAMQVAGAVTSSTLTTICVFAPIVFTEGLTRQLFVDMALTIAYSLVASLIVSLTVVPALTSKMLVKTKTIKTPLFDKFRDAYVKSLNFVLKIKPVALILVVAMLGLSAYGSTLKGFSFMPSMDSTQVSVDIQMPECSLLKDTKEMSNKIIEKVQTIDDVESIGVMLSSGTSSMMGLGGNTDVTSASMYIILKEDKELSSQEIATKINEMCADLDCEVNASGSSMDMSALGGSGVTINIEGAELETLQELASQVSDKLSSVEGISEVDNGMDNPTPQLKITIDKEKAMLNGLTVAQIYMELASEISSSTTATQLSTGGKDFDIIVEEGNSIDATRETIKNYTFTVTDYDSEEDEEEEEKSNEDSENEDDEETLDMDIDMSALSSQNQQEELPTKEVKLSDIATIEDGFTLSSISRDNQTRRISVNGTIADGYNVSLVTQDVEKLFEDFQVPEGYKVTFDGENETIMEAMGQLLLMLVLAIVLIYLIMVAQFQSLKSPFIVMFTLPLAFTGGFLGLIITGKELSVIAMLGFVMLAGIVVNNGIVLVDYINQLRLDGMEKHEAILEAGKTRLRPVLMTALTTILGLMMMALGKDMGSDMIQPLAIVTIGGLIYATFMTLYIIPIIYDIFNKKPMKKIDKSELELVDD
ncbi:MAG: efflux RND transporter permease subunit [Oscillospiraceae bacterium]